MISKIHTPQQLLSPTLRENRYGRHILSYFKAYGLDYGFCSFYRSGESVLLLINSTMLICGSTFKPDELTSFAMMNRPFRIEGTQKAVDMIACGEYERLRRTVFRITQNHSEPPESFQPQMVDFTPKLDDVYSILTEGFPNLASYELWMADTSHRVRRDISRLLTYRGTTTASIAYDIDDSVLVSQVATKVSARGCGYASEFLRWLSGYLTDKGKTAILYALDVRESFYRGLGFEAQEEEYVLERREHEPNYILKGRFEVND